MLSSAPLVHSPLNDMMILEDVDGRIDFRFVEEYNFPLKKL